MFMQIYLFICKGGLWGCLQPNMLYIVSLDEGLQTMLSISLGYGFGPPTMVMRTHDSFVSHDLYADNDTTKKETKKVAIYKDM